MPTSLPKIAASSLLLLLVALVGAPAGAAGPLASRPPAPVGSEADERSSGRLIVGLAERADVDAAERLIEDAVDDVEALDGAEVDVVDVVDGPDLAVVEVPAEDQAALIAALDGAEGVTYVEPDALVSAARHIPTDPLWGQQVGLDQVDFPTVWAVSRGTPEVVIAILDSGVEQVHTDLAPVVNGYDFVRDVVNTVDGHGHGTMTAGVAAARSSNGRGIAGACPACTVLDVRVLDDGGAGHVSTVVKGISFAVASGADVINLSLGTKVNSSGLKEAVVRAREAGILVVASAGNDGSNVAYYPAAYPEVLAVGGYNVTSPTSARHTWSNYGAWVDVAAPGCNPATDRSNEYRLQYCGTSSSAPVVSGLAGLLRSIAPDATPAELADAIVHGSHTLNWVAHGRIDAGRSHQLLLQRNDDVTVLGPARLYTR